MQHLLNISFQSINFLCVHNLMERAAHEYTQYNLHNIHMEHEWAMNLASHPNLLQEITAVLGPNVILLDSRFICKYSSSDVPQKEDIVPYVAWHQDIKSWGFEGGSVASVWLAFDDVDTENGVLQVIPGSHKQGVLEHRIAKIPGNMLPSNLEIPKHLVNVEDAVECPLKAGQVSVHDGLTLHANEPNMSDDRKCGFVICYIPTTAYPVKDAECPRTFPASVLVDGTDKFQNFQNNAPKFFKKTF
uniref:Uncharacterized protein n=1 Tax=Leptobrachium leishanense TaxID=445787 RepID=A0A8C5MMQ2_9ANUR